MDDQPLELEQVLDLVPELAGERTVTPLGGGLTNSNHRVSCASGRYVVRRWSEDSGLLAIDRDNEHHNSVSAAEAGVGAGVTAYLPEHNTLVLEWLEGETLSAQRLRAGGALLDELAAACRRLHGARRFRDDFDMFEIQPRYLRIVRERGFRLPDRYEEFAPQVAAIRAAFAVRPEATVPCNNDLLAENLMITAAGLRLIDYEYSGNNDPCFELGNVWSESGLSLDQLEQLVSAYYGGPSPSRLARARLWGLMSKYGWTLWASIQDGVSEIDFDFWEWGMEKYDRAVAEFAGPDFGRLLEDVQRQ
ncbi:MAG TPA: choline/ethanolamine kinase family protein [Solirubrobacteraceae bacterium]|jgi:thiamine kinase-like enzyme|nr:choline/ethanolamine kinase family protein [Solirubrobacteraceae bacterium]